MATCRQVRKEPKDPKAVCDLDPGHLGPTHYDSKLNVSWFDLKLPEPEAPEIPEPPEPRPEGGM